MSDFLQNYQKHVDERAAQGILPLPLTAAQTAELVELLKNPPAGKEDFLLDLFENRIPAGVDEAAYVKASFLSAVSTKKVTTPLISPESAVRILGKMQGGYNIEPLLHALDDATLAPIAATELSHTCLLYTSPSPRD